MAKTSRNEPLVVDSVGFTQLPILRAPDGTTYIDGKRIQAWRESILDLSFKAAEKVMDDNASEEEKDAALELMAVITKLMEFEQSLQTKHDKANPSKARKRRNPPA